MGNVETRMMELAETGNLKGLDQLLHSSPVDLQYQDKNGYTALHLAAKNGHFKCADLLIDRGVDLHTLDNQGATALHYACLSGSVKVIKRIITANPDLVIVKNKKERTPLHFLCIACGEGKDWVECAKILLSAGADPTTKDVTGLSPFEYIDNKNGDLKATIKEAITNPSLFRSRQPLNPY
eukprot:TRINITY_DN8920_c0_g1_i1.p1 TRINITY_DN8920_c0_g1~~TRINITY_DN8920_c0_g1_i1.p1  ORF type:complete len:181 (-),score=35.48 TRINITY_DN8920_c0_g1_i1:466-1008(-)